MSTSMSLNDFTGEELAKLPKWAARKVSALMQDRREAIRIAEQRLADWDGGAKPRFLIRNFGHTDTPVGTHRSTLTVVLDPEAPYGEGEIDVSISSDGELKVLGGYRLVIHPQAANVVTIANADSGRRKW